ncbi:MAG: 50S ribosomal protein L9 [Pseudomonadales bacterium]|jgi:large subunit ribosomal protein L9|nr:50S ribosomal protein L9 [Pseudomonadales bacterium]MDP6469580.1 50S ribosomal protein L9 [Pseudomonadales bacterium]MDP6827421.1 50S ribosomal protein L9 [Pseudomonadales bacterium]MDP6971244.1 50S ribosomal protein L9 [Pseudomonadales bacterium]|tara:strand:- start:1992 stop:2438 length:447 start_codon:yes stop_codon:yes gene_type:complete
MNVILLEPLANLGDLGEEVSVKPGFARNFLLPQGKAVRATDENRALFEGRRAELERAASDRLTQAKGRAAQLEGVTVSIVVKAGDEGKLYGSVGTQDIATALTEQGIEIQKSEVRMPEGVIRSLGEYEVNVQLHSEVTVGIPVEVVAE